MIKQKYSSLLIILWLKLFYLRKIIFAELGLNAEKLAIVAFYCEKKNILVEIMKKKTNFNK